MVIDGVWMPSPIPAPLCSLLQMLARHLFHSCLSLLVLDSLDQFPLPTLVPLSFSSPGFLFPLSTHHRLSYPPAPSPGDPHGWITY